MKTWVTSIIVLVFVGIISIPIALNGSDMNYQDRIPKDESAADSTKITVLYDNYIHNEKIESDWGFACLVEGSEKTILLDTGAKGELLLSNAEKLKIDLSKVDQLFLTHNHQDHTGGIHSVVSTNASFDAFVPTSFPEDFDQLNGINSLFRIQEPKEICKGIFSTGEMGSQIKEQSLIINTVKGLVIITGCSHQGIIEILKSAKQQFGKNIYLVLGGFHLLQHSDEAMNEILKEFKNMGVIYCGATHCTGPKQIQMFKEAYGKNYIGMGTGRIINITEKGLELE